MNVLHVVAAGEVGGAERMLVDLVRAPASRQSHAIALFTPSEALRDLLRETGVPVDDRGPVREDPLSFLRRSLGPSDVRWLADVARRRGAEILHLHTFASQVLGTRAALRVGARVLRTEHSTRVYDDPSCWPFSRWSLQRADAVVYISEHVRRVALARSGCQLGTAGVLARIVHNGVDTARFEHVALRPPEPPGARVRFLALGRLDRRKGLDLALEALARTPAAELDVVGDGDERAALERAASRLALRDRARFHGHASDVRAAIARADVVLSSAREEGLGIALLEAMAMGRPVVAFATGGIPEIVAQGETGWLAIKRTPDALAEAMRAAIEAPEERARRGALARERVVTRFSLAAMRDGYGAVYSALTG